MTYHYPFYGVYCSIFWGCYVFYCVYILFYFDIYSYYILRFYSSYSILDIVHVVLYILYFLIYITCIVCYGMCGITNSQRDVNRLETRSKHEYQEKHLISRQISYNCSYIFNWVLFQNEGN